MLGRRNFDFGIESTIEKFDRHAKVGAAYTLCLALLVALTTHPLYAQIYAQTGHTGTPANRTTAASKSSATKTYKVPAWWQREWTRRQYVKRNEDGHRAQEMKEATKAMWNPRSAQALAYRRAYMNSHKDLLLRTRTTNATKQKTQDGSTRADMPASK
jgi:hypothetical protein